MELRPAKVSHARRNLFGPVDHDHLQQDFQNMLWTGMERAMQRWNFDFLQGKPTEGLLQWEELPVHEVPTFYHTFMVGQARLPLQSMNWDVTKETKMPHAGKVLEQTKPAKRIARKKDVPGKKRRQTTVTATHTCDLTKGALIFPKGLAANVHNNCWLYFPLNVLLLLLSDYYTAKKDIRVDVQTAVKKLAV